MSDRSNFFQRMFSGGKAGGDPRDYEASYTAGWRCFEQRDYAGAVKAFSIAIRFKPDDTCAWEMFGSSLGNLGRYEESLDAFARVKALGHECESCWFNRSVAFWALGRREETLDALEQTVRLNPQHIRAWFDQALILGGFMPAATKSASGLVSEPFDGRHDRAVACFDKVLELDPNHSEAWLFRGHTLLKLSHQAQVRNRTLHLTGGPGLPFERLVRNAAESFDRAQALRPDDPRPNAAKSSLFTSLFGDDPADWPAFARGRPAK
jgi:tetratricopeptide (TPR) repeat protein